MVRMVSIGMDPVANHPDWYIGPCGCCENGLGNCVQMFCCLPCHYGKAMDKAQINGGLLINCCCFCLPCLHCMNHANVRQKYGIQGGNAVLDCFETCCVCIYCGPCRDIQEIQRREKEVFNCI